MELWKDTKRVKAQELLDWLLTAKSASSMAWVNMIAFAELVSSSPSSTLTNLLATQVLSQMKNDNKKTVEDFESILEEQLKANTLTANNRPDGWRFFMPIEVTLNADLVKRPKIRIFGKDFSFIHLAAVDRYLDAESRRALRSPKDIMLRAGIKVDQVPNVYLTVSSEAASWELAWKKIEPSFNALRGLIELTMNMYGWSITTRGKSPRRKIPHPLWIIAYKKDTPAEWRHFIIEEDSTTQIFDSHRKIIDLNRERFDAIKKNAVFLRKEAEPQSTLSLIADCLRLYSQAMDAYFRHLCFLGFWQLAEAITRSETVGGQTDKVVARLAWHGTGLGLKGSGYKETLAAFGKKRNEIVHKGLDDIEDGDINILKLACEVALNWLFRVHKSLPTVRHIEHYYRLRETSEADMEAIKDCVTFLKKQLDT